LKHARLPVQRASGVTEHPDLVHRARKRWRPLLLAAVIVLSIAVAGLHVVGGLVLLKTGLGGLSLQGPLAYIVIGLMLVVAVLKLTHVVGMMHRKEKREDLGED
jgi:hypothetical protein